MLLALLLAACSTPTASPPPTASATAAAASPASPQSVPQTVAGATPTPSAAPPVASGRPYTPETILDAMRASRRPGGVPDQLETTAIAGSVAEALWTYDGEPWQQMAIGGACGPLRCTLEVSGTPPGSTGSDLYTFAISPADGSVQVDQADLHGLPDSLLPQLDAAARADTDPSVLTGLALLGARWLPPPDAGRFWLAYRSGGEEGSPGVDLLLDLAAGRVLETRRVG